MQLPAAAHAVELRDVSVEFQTARGLAALIDPQPVRVLEEVAFTIDPGEIYGLGGESGSGKSTVANVLSGLVPVATGRVQVAGHDTTQLSHEQWRSIRRHVQLVFQDPFESLNPRFTVFRTVAEPLMSLGICPKQEYPVRVKAALERAELRPVSDYLQRRPGSLSGGERQRVAIARALVVEPHVLIADEPVSMLDSTTAAEITGLMRRLADDLRVAILLISHDLKLLARVCDRIGIMYLGRLVETGPSAAVLQEARHPYTQLLVSAVPAVDPRVARPRVRLSGALPSPADRPTGCPFHPRCPVAEDGTCTKHLPELDGDAGSGHRYACFHPPEPGTLAARPSDDPANSRAEERHTEVPPKAGNR